MVVLDAIPLAVFVNIGDDLSAINSGNELHGFVTVLAGGRGSWLDGSNYGSADTYSGCIAHEA